MSKMVGYFRKQLSTQDPITRKVHNQSGILWLDRGTVFMTLFYPKANTSRTSAKDFTDNVYRLEDGTTSGPKVKVSRLPSGELCQYQQKKIYSKLHEIWNSVPDSEVEAAGKIDSFVYVSEEGELSFSRKSKTSNVVAASKATVVEEEPCIESFLSNLAIKV